MTFVGMGEGPYYLLFRPYHLCNIEVPISVAEAVVYGETTLVPTKMNSDVIALAKRDLKAGDTIGDIGGFEVYHRIYRHEDAIALKGIPMGLATGAKVLRDIAQDEVVTEDSVALDTTRTAYRLRQFQDELLAGCG
jgi:predicted homoserine dehydrogenase-like protein